MSKGLQIAIGAVSVALLLSWYSWSQLDADATYQYYQTLEEFHAASSAVADRSLRVHGYVAEGTIERDVASKQVRFAVQNDPPHAGGAVGTTLDVVYLSLETPDLFKDGAEVVVEGKLGGGQGSAVFLADNVLAKCPSKFEAKAAEAAL